MPLYRLETPFRSHFDIYRGHHYKLRKRDIKALVLTSRVLVSVCQ